MTLDVTKKYCSEKRTPNTKLEVHSQLLAPLFVSDQHWFIKFLYIIVTINGDDDDDDGEDD